MSNPFALIARADSGGIAAQTLEVWRHLRPARTLVVDLGVTGRGPTQPALFMGGGEVRMTQPEVAHGYPTAEDTRWLVADRAVKTVFAVESIYGDATRRVLSQWGGRLVVQANPELFVADWFEGCDLTVAVPTSWERHRFASVDAVDLPVPVRLHPPAPIRTHSPLRAYHPSGAAMLDRNGTKPTLGAIKNTAGRYQLHIANHRGPLPSSRSHTYQRVPPAPTYEEPWVFADPDLLIIPRRYGGLSLPLQEAAARGIPIIASDLDPQNRWLPEASLVPVGTERPVKMIGGTFSVWDVSVPALTERLAQFTDPRVRSDVAEQVYAYAETLAWDRWADRYLALLCR